MKTTNLNPQQVNDYYEHKEVISNRMQWVAIITIFTALIAAALLLDKYCATYF